MKKAKAELSTSGAPGLSECVEEVMGRYFNDMGEHEGSRLYELVISQVEKPLFEVVLGHYKGNISRAAQVLGLNRGTLRSRLKKYGLIPGAATKNRPS